MAKAPPKVNTDRVLKRVDALVETLLAAEVRPRLQYLLNKAQAKTKYKLYWYMGMGVSCLHCEAPWERGAWSTADYVGPDGIPGCRYADRVTRFKEKFPELVEMAIVIQTLWEQDLICEDIESSVPLRPDDGTQDPADYVEMGPIMGCETPGCAETGTEDDFIVGNDDVRRCEACANKPENRHHYARRRSGSLDLA